MTDTYTVNWGEAIVIAAFRSPGGLKQAVDRIRAQVGPHIGTRNTFAKLMRLESPDGLDDTDIFRAWLLIAAFGADPSDYGLSDDVVPAALHPETLRADLRARQDSNLQPTD